MNPPPVIQRQLLVIACVCGLSSAEALAARCEQAVPALIGELRQMSPKRGYGEERFYVLVPAREHRQQWAALSPEQREQLRNQVLEHWQRMSPEQRQRMREAHQQSPGPAYDNIGRPEYRPQRLSPDERRELHQWMRIRRDNPP